MSLTVGEVVAYLKLDMTNYREGLAKATSLLEQHNAVATTAASILGGVGAAVAAAYVMMTREAAGFEAQMRNVNSILKQSEEGYGAMSQAVLDMAGRVGQAPAVLARGLYDIASSGFEGADGLEILEKSAVAATAGLTDTATAVRAGTAVLNAYGLAASDIGHVQDILFQTVNRGVITYEELASQIGDVVSTAAQARIPIEQVGAAIAQMTKAGVTPAESVTSLNQLLLSFISPSAGAAKAAKDLGLEFSATHLAAVGLGGVVQELAGRLQMSKSEVDAMAASGKSYEQILAEINKRSGASIEALAALFPSVRALRGALALTSGGGAGFAEELGQMQNAAEAANSAFAEQSKSFAVKWQKTRAEISAAMIGVGADILTALRPAVVILQALAAAARAIPAPLRVIASGVAIITAVFSVAAAAILMYNLRMKEAIALSGGFMAATANFGGLIAIFSALRVGAVALAVGIRGVFTAMGPIGWVALAAGVALGVLYGWYEKVRYSTDRATVSQRRYADALGMKKATPEAVAGLNELIKRYQELSAKKAELDRKMSSFGAGTPEATIRPVFDELTKASNDLVELRKKIASQAPGLVVGYDAEHVAILGIKTAAGETIPELKKLEDARIAALQVNAQAAERDLVKQRDRLKELVAWYDEVSKKRPGELVSINWHKAPIDAKTALTEIARMVAKQQEAVDKATQDAVRAATTAAEASGAAEARRLANAQRTEQGKAKAAEDGHARITKLQEGIVEAARKAGASEAAITKLNQLLREAAYLETNEKILGLMADFYEKLGDKDKAAMLRMLADARAMQGKLKTEGKQTPAQAEDAFQKILGAQLAAWGKNAAKSQGDAAKQAADAALAAQRRWADAMKGAEGEVAGVRQRTFAIRMEEIRAEAAELQKALTSRYGAARAEVMARQYVEAEKRKAIKETAAADAEIYRKAVTEWQGAIEAMRGYDQAKLATQRANVEGLYRSGRLTVMEYEDQVRNLERTESDQTRSYIAGLSRVLAFMQRVDRARRQAGQPAIFRQDELRLAQAIFSERQRMTEQLASAERSLADKRKEWAQEELDLRRQAHENEMSMIELEFQRRRDMAKALGAKDSEAEPFIAQQELAEMMKFYYANVPSFGAKEQVQYLQQMLEKWRQINQTRESGIQAQLEENKRQAEAEGRESLGYVGGADEARRMAADLGDQLYNELKQAMQRAASEERYKGSEEHLQTGAEMSQLEQQSRSLGEVLSQMGGLVQQVQSVFQGAAQMAAQFAGLQVMTPQQMAAQSQALNAWLQQALGAITHSGDTIMRTSDQVFARILAGLQSLASVKFAPTLAPAAAGAGPSGGNNTYNLYYNGQQVNSDAEIDRLMDQIGRRLEREHVNPRK